MALGNKARGMEILLLTPKKRADSKRSLPDFD